MGIADYHRQHKGASAPFALVLHGDESLPLAGTVLLEEKTVYGTTMLYPANDLARSLAWFRGATTFTAFMVTQAKAMGFTVHTTGSAPKEL